MAFLIRASPPSSPTMNMFGTLVSICAFSWGMSLPMLGLAMTMVMAPTGQTSAHRLWPMHLYPLTITACPASMASTSPSGQTIVHVAQPMQLEVSIWGCCDCGPSDRIFPFSADSRARTSLAFCWLRYRRTKINVIVKAISRPTRLFMEYIFSQKGPQEHLCWIELCQDCKGISRQLITLGSAGIEDILGRVRPHSRRKGGGLPVPGPSSS